MKTIFDLVTEVQRLRPSMPDAVGLEYYSRSNPSVRHYVVLRDAVELDSFKAQYQSWDFTFNLIAR
jgi:hypothetical protein